MQFSVYQESQIGGRKVNQDRMGYSFTREALLLVLADGMGGHVRGEVAASIMMQTISSMFQEQAAPYIKKPERFMEDAFLAAHDEIARYRIANKLPETPRTTVVACLVQHNTAIWAHCGDSRLYWLRHGQLLARTRDHSHIEYLIDKGMADASDRATHPDRNKLYNCIGASSVPRIEVSRPGTLQTGDVLMLCSDGLWTMLGDDEIARRLASQTIVRALPEMLASSIALAGPKADNTTALAIMWQGSGAESSPDGSDDMPVISTMMLPDDSISTTIGTTPEPASDTDAFDDDAIEKAIAEIRDAIEKSSHVLK